MPLMSAQEADFGQTPSQTVGPYFAYGLTATQYGYDFTSPSTPCWRWTTPPASAFAWKAA
jgi:hypothetical protein